MHPEAERQLNLLSARVVDLHSRADFVRKLEKSVATGQPLRIKMGADPSAPDLHLGHTVCLNKLREFQDLGHTVVFIIGDFTGMIGDPSGKSKTRRALSKEEVSANAVSYQQQVFKVLDPARTEIRYNSEWFSPMSFDEVIRLSAKVTVAQMLARDDFSKRYAENQPISLVEFLYPLVQAYDSVMVRADVEIGGTDQLFNLLLGRELQKEFGQESQVVLTLPLIEGLDGVQKMSKSLGNYVGITEAPREMFGKLMSMPDELMAKYASLLLARPESEVAALRAGLASGALNPRHAKDELAQAVIARYHDAAAATAASAEFARIFAGNQLPDEIAEVALPAGLEGEGGVPVMDLLVALGLAPSKGEAKRLVQGGAVKAGQEKVSDPFARIPVPDGLVVQAGKRKFARVRR
jgi:tyrosyl-tRNA synthetase